MNRHILLLLLLISAVGLPILFYETDLFKQGPAANTDDPQQRLATTAIPTGLQRTTVSLSPQQLVSPVGVHSLSPTQQLSAQRINMSAQSGLPVTKLPSTSIARGPTAFSASYSGGKRSTQATRLGAAPIQGNDVIFRGNAHGPNLEAAPLEFMPVGRLSEVIRFDVYPNWVKSRWKRVSTSATDYGLHGLRVPLVTGVNPADLHGSLTYYFDANQHVQRIGFRGWTGDATRLVDLLIKQYDFKAQQTHMSGLYLAKSWRKVTGALLLQHPTIIRADTPNKQVAVSFEINKPDGPFILSHEFASTLPNTR